MKNENENKKVFSRDNENMEIIERENSDFSPKDLFKTLDYKNAKNIFIGTVNVAANPLKNRHEKHYKENRFHLFADVILILIVIFLAVGWFVLGNYTPVEEVKLSGEFVSGELVSGEIESLEIKYETNNKKLLKNSTIVLKVPETFQLISVSPSGIFNKNTNTFAIGDLHNGANGKIKIDGRFIGQPEAQERITYFFNYDDNGKNKSVANSTLYNSTGSVINFITNFPDEAYSNSEFEYRISYKKNDFRTSVELYLEALNLNIKEIKVVKGEAKIVKGQVVFLSDQDLELFVKVETLNAGIGKIIAKSYFINGQDKYLQNESSAELEVIDLELKVGITSDLSYFKVGEYVNYKLSLKNNNPDDIKNLEIGFSLNDAEFGLADFVGEELTIDDGVIKVEQNIKPGELKELGLKVLFNKKKEYSNKELNLLMNLKYDLAGQKIKEDIVAGGVKALSQFNIKAWSTYYSERGDQLGIGPLPPRVDMLTNYWIFFDIINNGNDLGDVIVSGNLIDDVIWNDNKTILSGLMQYGDASRKTVWSVEEIKNNSQIQKVGFEVGIVPRVDDIGKEKVLIEDIRYEYFDRYCGVKIEGSTEDLTTDLKNDKLGSGKSEVIK